MQIGSSKSNEFDIILDSLGLFSPESQYKVCCPFHGDVNPSMMINRETSNFYCFGCNKSGSSFELVKYSHPELSDFDAMKLMKETVRNKSKLKNNNINNIIYNNNTKENYKDSLLKSKNYYFNLPSVNWYKVDEEQFVIKHYMNKRGFTCKTLNSSEAKYTYNSNYPIVFPMFENGLFRGYVMRTNLKEVEEQRKYMYNKGFHRRNSLPGQFHSDCVIVVEGFLDKLAANQLGFQNVVSTLGWKISSGQFEKLKRKNIKHILCALDNDECGRNGYKYLSILCEKSNIKISRVRFQKGTKDFGDLLIQKERQETMIKQLKSLGAT